MVVPVHCELLCAASSELQRVIELHESQKPDLELFSLPLHSISIQLSLAPHLPAVNIAIQSAASAVTPITPCMNDSLTSFDEDSGDAILLLLILYLYEPELWDKVNLHTSPMHGFYPISTHDCTLLFFIGSVLRPV